MKNIILFISIFTCFQNLGFCQDVSLISIPERDSIITIIKERRKEVKNPYFLQYYDQIDSSTNLLKIFTATRYNSYRFDYSKNLINFLEFKEQSIIFLIKTINGKDSILSVMSTLNESFGILYPPTIWHDLPFLLKKVDIQKSMIFYIQDCSYLFVYTNNVVFIFIDKKLLDANAYLKSKYTLTELADLFNLPYNK